MFYAPTRAQDDYVILSLLHNNDTQQVPVEVLLLQTSQVFDGPQQLSVLKSFKAGW